MDIHKAGANSVALVLGADELNESGLTPDQIDHTRAKQWVMDAFARLGLPVRNAVHIEAFTGAGCVMLVARAVWPCYYYLFDCFEDVLACAFDIGEEIGGSLFAWDECYVLALPERPVRILEYALPLPEKYALCLREYGKLLLERDALGQLTRLFKL